MLVDLIAPESWEKTNDQVKAALAVPSENNIRVYKGLPHSILEMTLSLAQLYVHKRYLGLIKGLSPAFDFMNTYFLRESYNLQTTEHVHLKSDLSWLSQLHKDTHFMMYAEDHPVTGELCDYDSIDKILNDRKIFSLRVSHFNHLYKSEKMRPYSCRICSYGNDLSIIIMGERVKPAPMMAHQMGWEFESIQKLLKKDKNHLASPFLVDEFEAHFQNFKYFKDANTQRLYDRSVLCFPDINGEALLTQLAQQFPREQNLMETTSACKWGAFKIYKGWWLPQPSLETLRGILVFASPLLEKKDFAKKVQSAYEAVKALQEW